MRYPLITFVLVVMALSLIASGVYFTVTHWPAGSSASPDVPQEQVTCEVLLKVNKQVESDTTFCGFTDPVTGKFCYANHTATPTLECFEGRSEK